MSLVVHAPNVHQGGGRTLLLPVLQAAGEGCTALLDERLVIDEPLPSQVRVERFAPTLAGRLAAERRLRRIARKDDDVLCFGNLPPLFASPARIAVFLQNRYLVGGPTRGFPRRVRMRLAIESVWLRARLDHARLLVQTASMAAQARAALGRDAIVMPFVNLPAALPRGEALHDFVYVASGEPHKNHRVLVQAWELLAQRGSRPSLVLTLAPSSSAELLAWVQGRAAEAGLRITNQVPNGPRGVMALYSQARAAVYPSLFESFGLPLLEARQAGLPIVAAERDYVRDVVEPEVTFDPESPVSIARAVERMLGTARPPRTPVAAGEFLEQLKRVLDMPA